MMRMGRELVAEKIRRLVQLLEELFSSEELRRFVALSHLREIRLELPEGTLATEAHALVENLNRRNLINADLFNSLLRERPVQEKKIKSVAGEWRIQVEYPGDMRDRRPGSVESKSAQTGHVAGLTAGSDKSWILAFSFGSVFIGLLLVIAIMVPRWTPEQALVFRVVLALAAAGVGAVLPGLLDVRARWADNIGIRAGGAVSLFVIVFLVTPATPHESMLSAKGSEDASIHARPLDSDSHVVALAEKSGESKEEAPQDDRSNGQISKPFDMCNEQRYTLSIAAAPAHSSFVVLDYGKGTWRLSAEDPYRWLSRIQYRPELSSGSGPESSHAETHWARPGMSRAHRKLEPICLVGKAALAALMTPPPE